MATYQFGDKSAINLMMAITNGLDREFMKRSEFSDLTQRLSDIEARLSGIGSGGSSSGGIKTIQLNGTRLPSTDGTVNINIPMQLSSYLNDSNFQNAAEVRNIFSQMLEDAIASGQIGQGGSSGSGNTVKIKTKPGAIVIFVHPDGTTITGKADDNGDLIIDLPKTGNWSIKSVSGNTTTTGNVTVDGNGQKTVDVTDGPTKTTEDYVVSLKTEPYATVAFVHPDGTVVTAKADGNGDLIVVLPKSGAWKIISVGNTNIPGSVTVTKPGVSNVDLSDSKSPVGDGTTYPVRVKVTPFATVIFTGTDGTTVSAVADANGIAEADLPYKGNWSITVIEPDSGNTSTGSVNVTDPDNKKDVDLSGETTSPPTQYIVTLKVKPGATVTLIHPDGDTVTGVADENGVLAVVVPKKGTWTILSMSGGKTDVGSVDVTNPGNTNVNVGGNDDNCTYVLEVQTTPHATVTAIHPDGTTVTTVADATGKAVLVLPKTGDWAIISVDPTTGEINGSGENKVSGNGTSKKDITNTGDDNIPPKTKVLTIKTDPYSKVTLVGPNGEVITGTADSNGILTIAVPSDGEWTVVTVTPDGETSSSSVKIDPDSGNKGYGTTVTPGGNGGSDKPIEGSYTVTVNTMPNATVYFIHPDGTTVKAKANASGVCTAILPKTGDWKVVVVDDAGNGIGDGNLIVDKNDPTPSPVTVTKPTGTTYPVVITTSPGATVTLVDENGNVVTGKADENGVLVVQVPSPGNWTVISNKDGQSTTTTVTVNPNGSATVGTLYPVPPTGGDDKEVTVTVKGTPNTEVYLVDENGNTVKGTTDGSGNLTIKLPHGGDWTVITVDSDGGSTDTKINIRDKGDGTAPDIDLTGTRKPSGTLYPVIITTDPGATVTLIDSSGKTITAKADENGVAIVFVPNPGSWTVVTAKDGNTKTTTVTVSSNGSASVVDLPTKDVPPQSGSVNVHTLNGAMVIAKRVDGDDITSGNADNKGNLTLTLDNGTWSIVGVQGDQCADRTITVPIAEDPVEITTASGSIFTVYVTTMKFATITAVHEDGTMVVESADESGFSILMLPKKGEWTITAKDSNNADRTMQLALSSSNHIIRLNFKTGDISGGGSDDEVVEGTFPASVYGMPYSTIYGINPSTGDATSGTAEANGKVNLDFPCSGLWRVFSVEGSTYYDGVVIVSPSGEITSTRISGNTGSIFIIYLTTDKGANYTFTHTDGSTVTGQADYDSGFDTVFLPKTGTWTLNTNAAGKTTTKNVVVENIGELLRVRSKA